MSKTTSGILFGAFFTSILLLSACKEHKPAEVKAATRPSVAVAKATPANLSRGVALTAEFRPYQEVEVMSKVAGYVRKMYVDVGDHVREGQVLATLEVPEMADELARNSANIDRANAEVARARDEVQRAQSAHQLSHLSYSRLAAVMKNRPGLLAQQEVDDAQSRDLVSEAQVSAAKSNLAVAEQAVKVNQAEAGKTRTLINYTRVTAPFAGMISKRFADTGSMIQAGTASQTQAMPLVRLSQMDLLRLTLPVPESAVSQIKLGALVEVRVPSLSRSFQGKVARFAGRLASSTRTMETEVDVPNVNGILLPGMFAEVDLTLEQHPNALSVPLDAVEDGKVMVVAPGNMLEIRDVISGLETADRVEIRSGLKPGEMVVIGNRNLLKPGQAVQPKVVELSAIQEAR